MGPSGTFRALHPPPHLAPGDSTVQPVSSVSPLSPLRSVPAVPVTRCARQRGVTLIELFIAMALAALLLAVAIPQYRGYQERSRLATATADIRELEMAIERFAVANNGNYPASLADVGGAPTDPWGRPYQYLNVTTANRGAVRKDRALNPINSDFDLYSVGPDGRSVPPLTAAHSLDDVVRARNGRFVGRAETF